MPAWPGLPRNHRAEPAKAGRAVIIGIADPAAPSAVTTRPCAVSGSELTSWMATRAPAGTMMRGLVRPAARNVSSGPPAGLATMVSRTVAAVKVSVPAALSTWAPAGSWRPNTAACAALTRGPGEFAHRLPMTLPGSVPAPIIPVPIMADGNAPVIQPGEVVPLPVIHRYPAWLIIQPLDEPPIMDPP